MVPFGDFLSKKWCSRPLFSCLKSTLPKSGIFIFCKVDLRQEIQSLGQHFLDRKSQNVHMLKSVAYAKEKYRFFGPKMTKWAHVDLRQEKQCFGRCFFGQKLIIGSENWDWGGGPKRYVFHSKSTCGHFVTFGPKSHAKTTVFYTTFRHGAVWWLLVPKSDAQTLCFTVSNRLCPKSEICVFGKVDLRQQIQRYSEVNSDEKITKWTHVEKCAVAAALLVFLRTKNDQMGTCRFETAKTKVFERSKGPKG